MTIGHKVEYLRKKQNLSLAELSKKIGVGASTILKWESGAIKDMKADNLKKLADALDTTPAYLMGWTDDPETIINIEPIKGYKCIPLVGTIACGTPITAEENIEGFVSVDEHARVDFALRCRGDSMINARIFDGDLVYIRKQPDVENGEIAAIAIDDEATLKRVYKRNERLELWPENPTFSPMYFEGEELDHVRILGKAIVFMSTVR